MFRLIKKVLILVLVSIGSVLTKSTKCVLLKNQECKAREVVINSEYMTFPYSIKIKRCNRNCNNITNPYSKVCAPYVVKNVSINMFDLMTLTNKTKQIAFHESCKCLCRSDPIVCNKKQKWNENKCRCECLIDKKCDNGFIWNISNYECEYRKRAGKLITEKECEEMDGIAAVNNDISFNKTILIKEIAEDCKAFVASSILFLLVVIVLTRLLIYFYVNSQ